MRLALAITIGVLAAAVIVVLGLLLSTPPPNTNGRDAWWIDDCARRRPLADCERDYDRLYPR